jgi:CRP-like cAMP-binding protein
LRAADLLADRDQIILAEGLDDKDMRSSMFGFLKRFLSSGPERTEIDWNELPMVRQIDPLIRSELLKRAKERTLSKGVSCIRQGANDRSLFVVISGRLAVAKSYRRGAEMGKRKVLAFLDAGAVFGEAAFFFGHPRSADVVALDDSRVLEIPFDPRMKSVDLARAEDLQTRIWFLQSLHSNPSFSKLPSDSLDALLHAGERRDFRAGQKIIQEGEAADACYFIVQGRVDVSQNMKGLGKLQNGDAFGEIALLKSGTLRTATVTAESDVLCIRVEGIRFTNLLKMNLPLAIEIEKLSKGRLNKDRQRSDRPA